jgi:hypothetical protein
MGDNRERALQVLDRMNEVMPESVIPTDNYGYTMAIGAMYEQLGRPEEFDKRARTVLTDESNKTSSADKIMVLDQYDYYTKTFRHKPAAAESLARTLIAGHPNFDTGYPGWPGIMPESNNTNAASRCLSVVSSASPTINKRNPCSSKFALWRKRIRWQKPAAAPAHHPQILRARNSGSMLHPRP